MQTCAWVNLSCISALHVQPCMHHAVLSLMYARACMIDLNCLSYNYSLSFLAYLTRGNTEYSMFNFSPLYI